MRSDDLGQLRIGTSESFNSPSDLRNLSLSLIWLADRRSRSSNGPQAHGHSYDRCPLYLDDQHGQPLDRTTVESSHSDRTTAEAFHSELTLFLPSFNNCLCILLCTDSQSLILLSFDHRNIVDSIVINNNHEFANSPEI
jgi:hypothetical protein